MGAISVVALPESRPTRSPTGDGPSTLRCMENEEIAEVSAEETGVEDELLIEEISIDGMCGVY